MSDEILSSSEQEQVPEAPSKTQLKHEMLELKAMGKRLIEMKPDQLAMLPLTDDLRNALDEAHRIKSHNASKRHLGFIGKLMRNQNIQAIQAFFDRLDNRHAEQVSFFHHIEHWRDRLINSNTKDELTAFLSEYPEADIQHLRQLIRNGQKEIREEKPPAAVRKLFRYLREIIESSELKKSLPDKNID